MGNSRKRVIYIDILRIIAIFAVINIHVISNYNSTPMNTVKINWWWFGNISHSLSRFSVPIFIMISGALLLDNKKEEAIKYFLKKRLSKVFIPFLFWAIIYIFWQGYLTNNYKNFNAVYIVKAIITNSVYYHLWFVYMIIPLYLITPFVKKWVNNLNKNEFKYLFFLWGVTTLYSFINRFAKINIQFNMSYISGYIGYFILGYYLYKTDINKKQRIIFYIIGGLGLVFTIIGTYFITKHNKGVFDQFMYGYLQPNIVLVSAAVFIFFKYHSFEKLQNLKIIFELSNASFIIYLIHPIVLYYLSILNINVKMINPFVGNIVTDCLTMIICFLIVLFLKRVPYANIITTGESNKTFLK